MVPEPAGPNAVVFAAGASEGVGGALVVWAGAMVRNVKDNAPVTKA